jgi:hypothetical protein
VGSFCQARDELERLSWLDLAHLQGLQGLDPLNGEPRDVDFQDRRRIVRFLTNLTLARAIGGIMVIATVFTLAAAALMRIVEPHTYTNYGEACWWAVQTVSTVGYGDNVPTTDAGRILATLVMIFGIALIPATTSLIVAVFMNQQIHRVEQPGKRSGEDT